MTARQSLTQQGMQDNGAERKTAPAGNRGLTSRWISRQEADVDIIVPGSRTTGQARGEIVRLQCLLALAIEQREHLVTANLELYRRSRHWFVDGGDGYCAACALPEANGRHTKRGVAA